MCKKYILQGTFLFVLLLAILISCKYSNKNITLENELSNTNQQNIDNDLYIKICDYINRENLLHNGLKGIYAYHLSAEQEIFYNKRLDFFIAILNNDKDVKIEYYEYAKEYYQKFPKNGNYYYFWSKDVLDYRLWVMIEEQFGKINLPMEYMNELIL